MAHAHSHFTQSSEALNLRLKQAKLSLTPTRSAILKLLASSHRVWSIEQVILALKQKPKTAKSSLVFTTIYRCLLKMEEAHLVRRTDWGDGVGRYEYDPGTHEHHHHVVCRKCEKVKALDDCQVSTLEAVVQKMGYQEIAHRLEFFAVCPSCQKKDRLRT